jgi:Family of unknown function (DUF6049)
VTSAGRRVGAAIAALVTVLATTGFQTARAAHTPAANPSPTASPANAPDRVAITLTDLEPRTVQPGDVLTIEGTMTNISGSQLETVSVVLRPSAHRINTRYDLSREADPAVLLGSTLQNTRQSVGLLDPGETVSWQFFLPVDQLNLPTGPDDFGAYPLAVDVRSTLGSSTRVTRLPTSMVWLPEGSQFVPTQISWLLPLTAGIHRAASTTFLNDQLATDLAPSGRLGRLLTFAAAAKVPLTYMVDPALIDDATVMTEPRQAAPAGPAASGSSAPPSANSSQAGTSSAGSPLPYQVAAGKDGTTPANGTGSATAASWLADLRTDSSAPGAALVGLPYADTDLVAVVRAGLTRETAIARSTGLSTLSTDLATSTLSDIVWPVGGTLDEPTLDDLASDYDTVVLDDTSLPPRDPNAVTGARTNLQTASGTMRAVLTDSRISALLTPGAAAANGGVRLAEQRFLADTMLITEQRPGAGSSVVVAPPRTFDPVDGFAATLLADSATVPWLQGANLGQVAGQPADGVPRSSLVYNDAARAAELRPSALAPIASLRSSLFAYSSILGSSTTGSFINTTSTAILRAESSALRGRPEQSAAITNVIAGQLAAQTAQVYIVKPGLITLTSRKEKIPITVVNNLPDPVTVQIRLTAVNAARLSVGAQLPFTVPGNATRHEVLVEVQATTGGRFDVEAQLWTPDADPRPYGASVPFVLNSTAYGAVALAIAASAAGLVFLLSAIRITRRIRASRRPPTEPGDPAPLAP